MGISDCSSDVCSSDLRIESFESIRGDSLARVLDHVPGTRSPLARPHAWHVLIEAVASDPDAESPAALIERLLAPALADGLIGDAVVAANEKQAEAFGRLRDSLSEADRADGPALRFDISVPVEAMPRLLIDAAAPAEARLPGPQARK